MNEQLPYDGELVDALNNLPLPGEDIAWQDMKRRLDKDNNDPPVIPPLTGGCGSYALILLCLVIAFLLIVDPAKWFHSKLTEGRKTTEDVTNSITRGSSKIPDGKPSMFTDTTNNTLLAADSVLIAGSNSRPGLSNDTSFEKGNLSQNKSYVTRQSVKRNEQTGIKKIAGKRRKRFNNAVNDVLAGQHSRGKTVTKKTTGKMKAVISVEIATDTFSAKPQTNLAQNGQSPGNLNDSAVTVKWKKKATPDTLNKGIKDTLAYAGNTKTDSAEKRIIYFSAGLGLHQLLPLAGQKSNPYNSLDRQSSLGDYVPSIYVRMYKDRRWFIQSELRYGAPQYTRNIVFSQKKVIDTFTNSAVSTEKSIKKTFYHQLPVSFDYFVLPGLSVGAGIAFNKFKSAIVQQEVHRISTVSQYDSLESAEVATQKKPDSNFVTTYFQGLLEMQLQYRRFSIGGRYSFGLQPYLKFKLPGGEERRESNTSLQLFIRYEIWRSKRKAVQSN